LAKDGGKEITAEEKKNTVGNQIALPKNKKRT
jgi:hypothetical protein